MERKTVTQNLKFSEGECGDGVDFLTFRIFSVSNEEKNKIIESVGYFAVQNK